jgi:glycosyltransferase involved in cell wall biosynthesis
MILIIVPKKVGGVEYHRMLIPHYDIHARGMEVSQADSIELPYDFLKKFSLVVFSRCIGYLDNTRMIVNKLKRMGIKTVVDIDDYWILPQNHYAFHEYKDRHATRQIEESIALADHVTCTTPIIARQIEVLNKNVTVVPNAIDPKQPQFIPEPTQSEKIRFGYVGGAGHIEDLRLMDHSISLLHNDDSLRHQYKLVTVYNGVEPKYRDYERIFTGDFTCNRNQYERISTMDVYNYGAIYNRIDVALAPLRDTLFNSCKSQIKAIEAGFMGKALIASDVMPYTIDLNNKNSILIRENRHRDWYKAMVKLIRNPSMREDLAKQLTEDMSKYNITEVNKTRLEIYNNLCN